MGRGGELSGGLDSAIVAGSLAATGQAGRARFLNFHGDWREGDERPWAEAVAHRLELDLATVRKPVEAITLRQLRPLGESVRPALQGVDVTSDGEVAARMRRGRATALVTGQGGDADFFQAPDPAVAADRFRREGPPGLSPAFLAAVGRWTRHSAWTVLGCALGLRDRTPARVRAAASVAGEPRGSAAGQDRTDAPVRQRPAVLGRLPARPRRGFAPSLLSQPVVEHCLAIPADRLIAGVRDRGLARRAFADRLPPMLIERRNKGDLSCFYGHVTRASLASLRPLLLNGLQVDQGLLDGKALERDLAEDRLIVGPGYNRLLVGAVLEVWAQNWEGRIADIRPHGSRLSLVRMGSGGGAAWPG